MGQDCHFWAKKHCPIDHHDFWLVKSTEKLAAPIKKWRSASAPPVTRVPQFLKVLTKTGTFSLRQLEHSLNINILKQHSACWQTHIYESFQPIDEILIDYQCLMVRLLSEPCWVSALLWLLVSDKENRRTKQLLPVQFHSDIITISWFDTVIFERETERNISRYKVGAHVAQRTLFWICKWIQEMHYNKWTFNRVQGQ